MLFDVTTSDHRYPLMDESASLPALLAQFDPRGLVGGFAHLERRMTSRTATFSRLRTVTTSPGDEVAIEAGENLIWDEIEAEPSVVGRVLAMAYKLPPISRCEQRMARCGPTASSARWCAAACCCRR